MNILHEIVQAAERGGTCTLEWRVITSRISGEGCLNEVKGYNDRDKLKNWAHGMGFLIDLDLEHHDFSTEIRSVTFRSMP